MHQRPPWLGARALGLLLAAGTLCGCAGGGDDGPTVIRLGHIGFPDSPFDHGARHFRDLLHERFPGQVEVRVYGAGQLGEDREMLEGLRLGTLEMHVPSSVLHSVAPEFALFDLPFVIGDRDHFERVAESPIGESLRATLQSDHGLTLLAFWENGFRVITNNIRPVVTPAHLQGIRLRTPKDPERMRLFETLGANPASMSFGEVFSALRQGVVDGQENPLAQLAAARLHEVQRFLSKSNHVYTPAYPVVRTGWFETLAPDLAAGLLVAARETGDWLRDFLEQEDVRLLAELGEQIEIHEIEREAFRAAAEPVFEHYRERYGEAWLDLVQELAVPPPD